ncbi:oxygenase MpaB family protein [Haliea sp. E17]|uniref:oxygenase MpaB family protein n=1 Tax=Haliea sp. E17 TaxID=3401576 RepID=UPI003AACFC0D
MTATEQAQEGQAGRLIDFTRPAGEPALIAPDSVSWRVFKNPLAMYIGGITAVILEFAEPRIRTGVWEHTSFRDDPLPRLKRTGLAAMVTVYGARSVAERMIAGVTRMHARVKGSTPDGVAYEALEPELMNWVQATASFGFLQAYHHFVRPLSDAERDSFYFEALPAAALYGAPGAPASEAEQQALFESMYPQFEDHAIVREFLEIIGTRVALPGFLRPLSHLCLRAAVEILPGEIKSLLDLSAFPPLNGFQRCLLRFIGRVTDRIPIRSAPPARACRRLGLPPTYLYHRK